MKKLLLLLTTAILVESSLGVASPAIIGHHNEVKEGVVSMEGLTQDDLENNSATIESNLDYKTPTIIAEESSVKETTYRESNAIKAQQLSETPQGRELSSHLSKIKQQLVGTEVAPKKYLRSVRDPILSLRVPMSSTDAIVLNALNEDSVDGVSTLYDTAK